MQFHLLSLFALAAAVQGHPSKKGAQARDTSVDVLIIGGGATGTYAATRLRDQGKTVAVIESCNKLGGHVDTFYDPATGAPIDYGVQAYIVNNQTQQFFGRFDVALNATGQSPFPTTVVDFKTGLVVPNATAPDITQLLVPLVAYLTAVAPYTGLAQGYYDITQPVPEALLQPFGQFVAENNLSDVLQLVWQFAHGVGNLLETPTLYVLQNFGLPHILGLQSGFAYAPAGNQQLYDRAAAFLGRDVLFSSRVVSSKRTASGVTAVVQTPKGKKTIRAKKLLITIPPTRRNLAPFDLDRDERAVFGRFQDIPYHVGVVRGSSLPTPANFYNVDLTAAPAFLPTTPFVFRLETVGVPGYQTVKVIGEANNAKARALALEAAATVGTAVSGSAGKPELAAWGQHRDLQLHVSTEDVKAGFYGRLYGLQGKRSTFYTGNAWASDYSPLLWAYTEERVLPRLL
ncbi:hypothetical protein ACHAQA_004710 [Verticillium albo-atrum]